MAGKDEALMVGAGSLVVGGGREPWPELPYCSVP